MTAYELRRHLAAMHRIVMWGAPGGFLTARHDADHHDGLADHAHDTTPAGDG